MRAIEKIWFVLHQINEARGIAPKGKPIILKDGPLHKTLGKIDAKLILEKLENDESIIKVIQKPHWVRVGSNPDKKWRRLFFIHLS